MRTTNICILGLLVFVLFAFILSFPSPCSAQLIPFSFYPPVNPFFPSLFSFSPFSFFPPVPTYPAATLNPLLTPYTALPTVYPRAAAATLVVLPPPAPTVTAYAPLGTLNLTPSTLVFLILLFTLPE